MTRLLLAVIAALTVALAVQYAGKASVERSFALYKVEIAQERQKAQAALVAEQSQRQREVERIAHEAEKNRQALVVRAVRAESAVVSLRDEIDRLNARPIPSDPVAAAFAGEAGVARELLGQCSARYKEVAGAADELRDQVIQLQDFARSVLGSR